MSLFALILFETLCASCTWISVSFSDFGSFHHNLLKHIAILFSLSSSSGTPIIQMLECLMLSQRSLKLLSLFKMFFFSLFALLIGWFPLFCLPDYLCIVLYHLVFYSFLLLCFLFQLLNSSFLIESFLFSSSLLKCSWFRSILSLIQLTFFLPVFWILYLVKCLFLFHYLYFRCFVSLFPLRVVPLPFHFA